MYFTMLNCNNFLLQTKLFYLVVMMYRTYSRQFGNTLVFLAKGMPTGLNAAAITLLSLLSACSRSLLLLLQFLVLSYEVVQFLQCWRQHY